jgi:N-acetylmuramoyl-L-alanine amidase
MSKHHYIIDNGHGGMKNGAYQTKGKMFDHGNGLVIYEGVFNRSVTRMISVMLSAEKIEHTILVPEVDDISLRDRVKRTNDLNKKVGGRGIFISVHGNAGGGSGSGFEVFTTVGETKSDKIADYFVEEMSKLFPMEKMRVDTTDGDLDKEVNFAVLMCDCPAVLTENFFFDNLRDALIMSSAKGVELIARAHVNAILRIENEVDEKPTSAAVVKTKTKPKK